MGMFQGVIPILPTPFFPDERIDLESWQRLLEFMVELGVDGVTILGVLGESDRLTDRERESLIASAVRSVARRLPIIVGASHGGTEATRYLSRMAEDLGADAVMITPSKQTLPDEGRIVEYFQGAARDLAIPLVLQDHPASSEVSMSVALMLRLLNDVPAIACIKEEAVPTAPKVRRLLEGMRERSVPILTGLGALYAPFDLEAGAGGFNTGFAFPEVLIAMVGAARAGDWDAVHGLYARFAALIVFEQQPGVAVRKEVLRRRGLLSSAHVRRPGVSIAPTMATQLEMLLQRTLPGVNITRPIAVGSDDAVSERL